ncbi:MAG: hypothetical protein KIH01_00835 [Candidatus Freyarchaeota archaeon]|nr:hypothetical protein [Candidatus Jordarchaeia archaeon]
MSMRPLGASLLGILYILVGVACLVLGVLGILSLVGVSANLSSAVTLPFLLVEKYNVSSHLAVPFGVTLLLVHLVAHSAASNVAGSAALSFLLLPGTVMAFTGGGLLKLFNWARKSAIAFSAAGIIAGVILILVFIIGTIIGFLLVLLSILVLWYLSKPEVEGLFT